MVLPQECYNLRSANCSPKVRVVKTVVLGNGGFGKRWFCLLPKTRDFDENGENDEFAFYTQKQGVLVLRSPKMTKMVGHSGKTMVYQKRSFHNPEKGSST